MYAYMCLLRPEAVGSLGDGVTSVELPDTGARGRTQVLTEHCGLSTANPDLLPPFLFKTESQYIALGGLNSPCDLGWSELKHVAQTEPPLPLG